MKQLIIFILISIATNTFGQEGVKFKVEKLSTPEELLNERTCDEIYKRMILSDLGLSPNSEYLDSVEVPYNIIVQSETPESLVGFGYHSFFNGMYKAYADHRPFVLSPDMIWLLISQGFARHVNANSEELRDKFVDFDGKLTLTVLSDNIPLDSPPSSWESIFPKFTEQIALHTKNGIVELLTSDFSTTTPVEKVASEITIMEAMEPYFEFVLIYTICGIPEITLKGTTDDWQKILDKTKQLEEYDLKWWTDELEPILEEFVKASKGDVDQKFWRNMFKYHSKRQYGAPNVIDGWIVKFFPYTKEGKRNDLKQLKGGNSLPEEIVKVDLKYIELVGDVTKTIPLELWAGFIGLEQNPNDYTLTPKIGWMIKIKDVEKFGLKQKLEADNLSKWGGISIRVKEIPKEIYDFHEIKELEIYFIDRIIVPDQLKEVKIGTLVLLGKIEKPEIERIRKMFPTTELYINRELINTH
jgi:hypothetical protein